MIRLTSRALAAYMISRPARQRRLLRTIKYPDPEAPIQAHTYYREARDLIVAYLLQQPGLDPSWLRQRAVEMDRLAGHASGLTRIRLGHNARGLDEFARHYADRAWEVLPNLTLYFRCEGVEVSARPDLHVMEGRRERLIRLDFAKRPPREAAMRIVSQTMLDAARQDGLPVTGADVIYLDVTRGEEYKAGRHGTRLDTDIRAACQSIRAIWDTL